MELDKNHLKMFIKCIAKFLVCSFSCCVMLMTVTYFYTDIFGDSYLMSWYLITALIISSFFTIRLYAASLIFGLGSMAGIICHYEILLQQAPHYTQKAGMLLFFIQFTTFILSIIFEVFFYNLKQAVKRKKENK